MNSNRQPFKWYAPKNTNGKNLDAWANDPCTILYDKKQNLYYSWMLFRDGKSFPSGWIEMTSPDLNTWTQTEMRIKVGSEFFPVAFEPGTSGGSVIIGDSPAAMGGSVWIDEKGKFFQKGDVIFLISMQPCKLMDKPTITGDLEVQESGIAYYVSHGLGQPIYKAGILTLMGRNPTSTDWRDPYIYETEEGLYFAISAHNRIEFWKINSFNTEDIKKVDELYVRSFGVEVPNVVRFGDNTWYISCSAQDAPHGKPFQTAYWYLCTLEGEKFTSYANGQHEYGTEGYAHRVVNPFPTKFAKFAILRAMAANWNYNTDIWEWKGGCYGSEKVTISNNKVYLAPYDEIGTYSNNGTAVYKIKGKALLSDGYKLSFDKGDFTFFLVNDIITWTNDVATDLLKWTTTGGEATPEDDIIIIWNRTTLTFYNITAGWNAHFMLPEGTTHQVKDEVLGLI